MTANDDTLQRTANIIDGYEWSRTEDGTVGEQIAARLNRAGLLTDAASEVGTA